MIVADTNIIVYLLVRGEHSKEADEVYGRDGDWVAPALWRSEFCNALANYCHQGLLGLDEALVHIRDAEHLMRGREMQVASERVLRLAVVSGCSAYDCEFVALAQDLGVRLVTADRMLLSKFKPAAVSLRAFGS